MRKASDAETPWVSFREAPIDLAGPAVGPGAASEWVGLHRAPAGAGELIAGVTTAGEDRGRDFALFGSGTTREVLPRWTALAELPGVRGIVHARQVHEAAVVLHRDAAPGLRLIDAADGHVTRTPGLLLTVTIADCVPVFVVDRRFGGLALLHAGWRSAAAGILERGIDRLGEAFGSRPADLRIHFGPSIGGDCYEVGPEVFSALGEAAPDGPANIDLRAILARRAADLGVPAESISISEHCTRQSDGLFFSHRGGDAGRQIAVLGWRFR